MNAALLIPHTVTGLGIAAGGAQRLFGWFGGGPVNSTGGYGKGSNDFGLF